MSVPSEQEFRAPASAWIAAIASFLFVSIGLAILAAGVVMVLPKEMAGIAFFGLLGLSPILGGVSAWQSFKKSREKAYAKAIAASAPQSVARPPSRARAYLLAIFGGGFAGALVMWFTSSPLDQGLFAILGAFAGATLCGLLVRIIAPRPKLIPPMVACPGCGERVLAAGPNCPVCGAALPPPA